MNTASDSSAHVALTIATLQHRKKVHRTIGGALIGAAMLVPLLYAAKSSESARKVLLEAPSSEQISVALASAPGDERALVVNSRAEQSQSRQTLSPSADLLRGLKALTADPQYGEFAGQLTSELNKNGGISDESLEALETALNEKLVTMESSLNLAVKNNDLVLLQRLVDSRFFQNYAAEKLRHWSWLTKPTKEEYITYSRSLTLAEGNEDAEAELEALHGIRSVAGQNIHSLRIEKLEAELKVLRKVNLQSEFSGLMSSAQYDALLAKAASLSSELTNAPEIQEFVLQAKMAQAKDFRDEMFASASSEASADNWRVIPDLFSRVPSKLQGQEFKDLQNRATSIMQLQDSLVDLLREPARLVDENVQSYAEKRLIDAAPYEALSPTLSRLVDELEKEIEVANITVQLFIESDNRATILIPGLGYVEPTEQKSLWLHKKRYTFIVRCVGETDIYDEVDLRSATASKPSAIRLACGS